MRYGQVLHVCDESRDNWTSFDDARPNCFRSVLTIDMRPPYPRTTIMIRVFDSLDEEKRQRYYTMVGTYDHRQATHWRDLPLNPEV